MSNFKRLSAKLMQEKLKKGWTMVDFANYFECSSEDDFQKLLEKTFSKPGTREMLARLKKNEKLPKKVSKEMVVTYPDTFDSSDEITISEEQCNDIVFDNVYSEMLEDLNLQREDIQSSLNELELSHKSLVSDRAILRKKIDDHKETLKELSKKVAICKTDLVNLVSELKGKYSLMQELDKSISGKREELSEINIKIKNAQSITIYVYSSGDIDIEATSSVEIPEANTDTVGKIISDEQAENLTLKQIKTTAKLIAMIQCFEQQGLQYALLFDEPVMEELFYKIKE